MKSSHAEDPTVMEYAWLCPAHWPVLVARQRQKDSSPTDAAMAGPPGLGARGG